MKRKLTTLLLILLVAVPIAWIARGHLPAQTAKLRCFNYLVSAKIYEKKAELSISRIQGGVRTSDNFDRAMASFDGTKVIAQRAPNDLEHQFLYSVKSESDSFDFGIWYDSKFKAANDYYIVIDGNSYGCQVLVPLRSKKGPGNSAGVSRADRKKIERCIDYIQENVRVAVWDDGRVISGMELFDNEGKWQRIDQCTALELSRNWDFRAMKSYTNDDYDIKSYEIDACEVVQRIKDLLDRLSEFKAKY
ncbi:MAG: hypothetical protein FWG80_01660 [Alphaproteobacteria bacterium]|nr:hypothetical protein [Alphaproteobacteria bacterium]